MGLISEMRALLGKPMRVRAPHKPTEPGDALRGPVRIRAHWNAYERLWDAIEGSHRLALADRLGVPVEIIPVKLDDVFPNENPDATAIFGQDPGVQAISVRDALDVFEKWGPRPVYDLDVIVV